MEKIKEEISNNLKREIESCGITKSEIASQVGISKATLSQYLSGQILPTLTTLTKLCIILDCSADDILPTKKRHN